MGDGGGWVGQDTMVYMVEKVALALRDLAGR